MSNPYKPLNRAQLKQSAISQPIQYLVDGLFPVGSLNMLAGKPKSGKSTLSRQLAVAVSKGQDFLGRSTVQGQALYFASEELGAHLDEHFDMLGSGADDPNIHTVLRRPGSGFVSRLGDTLKELSDVRLVIIDPLVNFTPGTDMDKYGEVAPAMAELVEVAEKYGVSIVCVHHTKKRNTDEAGDAILGSSAIVAAMCSTLFLTGEMGDTRKIRSSQRYGTRMEFTDLDFDPSTRSYGLGQTSSTARELKTTKTREHIMEGIVMYTRLHADGITQEALRTLLVCKASHLIDCLSELESTGKIIRKGDGKKGSPFVFSTPSAVTIDSESPAAII